MSELTVQPKQEAMSPAQVKFAKAIEVITKIADNCKAITVIENEQQYTIATDQMKEAKEALDKLEAKRKILKQPSIDEGKEIDALAAKIKAILEPALISLKQLSLEHLKRKEELRLIEQEKQLAEERAIVLEQKKKEEELRVLGEKLTTYIKSAIVDINEVETDDALKDLFNKYVKAFPGVEVWGTVNDVAQKGVELIRKAGKTKRNIILYEAQLPNANEDQAKEIKGNLVKEKAALSDIFSEYKIAIKEQEKVVEQKLQEVAIAAVEKQSEVLETKVNINKPTAGLRKRWKYEMVDPMGKDVPDDWKTVSLNTMELDQYLNSNKAILKDGQIVNGVKFYQTTGLSGK